MAPFDVYKATCYHANLIHRLQCDVYPNSYWESFKLFDWIIALGFSLIAVDRESESIIGYILAHPIGTKIPRLGELDVVVDLDINTLFIHDLCVSKNLQRHGIGSQLLIELFSLYPTYTLAGVSLSGAYDFWKRHGFVDVPYTDDHDDAMRSYGDGAVYMVRK
jgi:GNAT superfamily N-acetyltransferase